MFYAGVLPKMALLMCVSQQIAPRDGLDSGIKISLYGAFETAHVKSSIWPQSCELSRSRILCWSRSASRQRGTLQPCKRSRLCRWPLLSFDFQIWWHILKRLNSTTFLWTSGLFSIAIYYPDGLRVQFLQSEIKFQCDWNVSMKWPFLQNCCAIKTIFRILLTDLIIKLLNKKQNNNNSWTEAHSRWPFFDPQIFFFNQWTSILQVIAFMVSECDFCNLKL